MLDTDCLESKRLIIREFKEDDWEAVHDYCVDPEVVRYLTFGPNTEDETRAFLHKVLGWQNESPRTHYEWAVVSKESGRLIGACRMYLQESNPQIGEIGYVLNRHYWGQGYMSEVARALLEFGFDRLHLHRIWAYCCAENKASARVMEKAGMKYEGLMRHYAFLKGQWHDSLLYAIILDDWRGKNG